MQLILIVEDEYGTAEMLQLLLETNGYRVLSASNGKAALEQLTAEKPAVIVSDFMMPHMHGGELGEAVRKNAALAGIPFIFVSGTAEDVVRQAFSDYDAFILKPAGAAQLLALIGSFAASGRTANVQATRRPGVSTPNDK